MVKPWGKMCIRDRHKAYINSTEKKYEPQVCIEESRPDPKQLVGVETPRKELKHEEKSGNWQQRQGYLFKILRKRFHKILGSFQGGGYLGENGGRGGGSLWPVNDAQQQYLSLIHIWW